MNEPDRERQQIRLSGFPSRTCGLRHSIFPGIDHSDHSHADSLANNADSEETKERRVSPASSLMRGNVLIRLLK